MLGKVEITLPTMPPTTPKVGTIVKAKGKLNAMVTKLMSMRVLVSPMPVSRVPKLMCPAIAYRLMVA